MKIQVRPMQPSDVVACGEIVDGLTFFQDWGLSGAQAQALLADALAGSGVDVRVAVADGVIVGFAWVVVGGAFGRSAYLRLIATRDSARGQGVGAAMMAAFEADLLPETDVMLLVTQTNVGARRFYERLGYQAVGTLPDYVKVGVTECIYFKARQRKE